MGECDCKACDECRKTMGENAMEVGWMRQVLDEVRCLAGEWQKVPANMVPAVLWDLADWEKRVAAFKADQTGSVDR